MENFSQINEVFQIKSKFNDFSLIFENKSIFSETKFRNYSDIKDEVSQFFSIESIKILHLLKKMDLISLFFQKDQNLLLTIEQDSIDFFLFISEKIQN